MLITAFDADELPPHGTGQLLTPWPNRVDGGRYTFGGEDYHLALSEPPRGNAIHGLTRWVPWTRTTHDRDEVTLRCLPLGQQGYPFGVQVDVTYRVAAESGLHVTVTATNKGSRPAPWGTGTHPYLSAGTATIDECELELPADQWLPVDDRLIPSGPGAGRDGDRVRPAHRTEAGRHQARHTRSPACAAIPTVSPGCGSPAPSSPPPCGWTRPTPGCRSSRATRSPAERRRIAVAVEPMTCPPNAFVSGEDLIVLQPKESVTVRWGVRAE